jgi:hypothetical protein
MAKRDRHDLQPIGRTWQCTRCRVTVLPEQVAVMSPWCDHAGPDDVTEPIDVRTDSVQRVDRHG